MKRLLEAVALRDMPDIWSADAEKLAEIGIFTNEDLTREVAKEGLTHLADQAKIPREDLSSYYEQAKLETNKRTTKRSVWWFSIPGLPIAGALAWVVIVLSNQFPTLTPCQEAYTKLYKDFERSSETLGESLAVYDNYHLYLKNPSDVRDELLTPDEFGCEPNEGNSAVIANILQLKAAWHDQQAIVALATRPMTAQALENASRESGIAAMLLIVLQGERSHRESASVNAVRASIQQAEVLEETRLELAMAADAFSSEFAEQATLANERYVKAMSNARERVFAGFQGEGQSSMLLDAIRKANNAASALDGVTDMQVSLASRLDSLVNELDVGTEEWASDHKSSVQDLRRLVEQLQGENKVVSRPSDFDNPEDPGPIVVEGCDVTATNHENLAKALTDYVPESGERVVEAYTYYGIQQRLIADVPDADKYDKDLGKELAESLLATGFVPNSEEGLCMVRIRLRNSR